MGRYIKYEVQLRYSTLYIILPISHWIRNILLHRNFFHEILHGRENSVMWFFDHSIVFRTESKDFKCFFFYFRQTLAAFSVFGECAKIFLTTYEDSIGSIFNHGRRAILSEVVYTSPKQGGAKGSTKGSTRGQESGLKKTHNRI
jgi:hypothetical protein